MRGQYSIGTLMMLTALSAVAFLAMRAALVEVWQGNQEAGIMMAAGTQVGLIMGVFLSIWGRSPFGQAVLKCLAGVIIGAGAGAQISCPANWSAIAVGPIVLVGLAMIVRRRYADLRA